MSTDKENTSKQGISRREFFKKGSLAAGGLMLGSLAPDRQAYAADNDTLRLALIGCGGRGTGACSQALKADPGVKLVAMADTFRDQLDKSLNNLTNMFKSTPVEDQIDVPESNKFVGFDGYKKAIAAVDVVILTTPPGFRPLQFEEAVRQGKHVFMEKPLATCAPGIQRIFEAAEQAKAKDLKVVVGLQRHYSKTYNAIKNRIDQGAIGDIISGQVYWNSSGVWVHPRKPDQTEMQYQVRNWYYFTWLCGDHILEQHIHNIDVANWFIGDHPVSAQGSGGREVRTAKKYGQIFDHHFVEFTYPNGAVVASQCRQIPGCWNKVAESFQGTKGTSHTEGYNGVLKTLDGRTIYKDDEGGDPNPYQVEHNRLFACIRSGEEINDAKRSAISVMTAIMGRMATYSGQVITWDDALNYGINIMPDQYGRLTWEDKPPVLPGEDGFYPVAVPGETEALKQKRLFPKT